MIIKIKKNNKCGYGRVFAHKCNNLCKQKQNKRVRKERIDLLNNSLREYSSKLYELENWIIRLERGEFD